MGTLTSVKRLSLCLYVTASLLEHRIVFYQLVHLELCGCSPKWWELLTWMLLNSPKLQVLKLNLCGERSLVLRDIEGQWGQPSSVPECLLLHLNTFEWKHYNGRHKEEKLVAYILNNATCLKTATFSVSKFQWMNNEKVTRKLEELVSMSSSSCQLLVD